MKPIPELTDEVIQELRRRLIDWWNHECPPKHVESQRVTEKEIEGD